MKRKILSLAQARTFCLLVSTAMLAVSLLVLTHGWMLGHDATVRLLPEFRAMVPSTALCFALLGIAFTQLFLPRSGLMIASVAGITGAVVTICLANLAAVYLLGGTGIDGLFRASRFAADRMSILTSFGLLLCAGCILAMLTFRARASDAMTTAALVGFSTGLTVIAGHAFDPRSLYDIGLLDGISVPTAFLFSLFFAAVVLLQIQPEE